ncbi:hypothetical protein ACFSKM_02180 [Ancylobacter dichloromethanicus]
MINHIYHVRERQIDIAIANEGNKEKQHKLHAERTKMKNEWPSAIRVVYYELIFFKKLHQPAAAVDHLRRANRSCVPEERHPAACCRAPTSCVSRGRQA